MRFNNIYKLQLLKQLYGQSEKAVSELSKGIQKSIPYTSAIISELIEEGVIIELGLARSNGGRRPQLYSIREGVAYIVGVAVNQLKSTLTVFDLNGSQIIEPRSHNITLTKDGNDLVELGEFINDCLSDLDLDKSKILGIGIGMPGFINVRNGQNHSFLYTDVGTLTDNLQDLTGLPVLIDNDSSLIGLAELRHGWARNRGDALVINIGWGVGLGMIFSNKVFRGENGYAGEFSHIPLYDNNKVCSCGKLGCLETECSLNVLVEIAREELINGEYSTLPESLPSDKTKAVELIFQAIKQGDSFSVGLLKRLGHNLGRGISILIHLLNPGLIVLSGLGSVVGKYWWAPVQQAINEYSIGQLAENTELKISKLGPGAELVGAAALVVERLEEVVECEV